MISGRRIQPAEAAHLSNQRHIHLTIAVSLLLAFWFTRLIALEQFPIFTDEAFHVRFARNVVEKGILSNAEEGRQLTIWLYTAVQADQNAMIFTARTITLLAVLPGFAAFIASGFLLAGTSGGLLAGSLYVFSVYHLFFERLALADPVSASALSVALFFTLRLSKRVIWREAVLVGVLLFISFGAKVLSLPFLAMPLAGAVLLPGNQSWRRRMAWGIVASGIGGVLIAAFVLLLVWRDHNPFFYLLRNTDNGPLLELLLARIPRNIVSNTVNLEGFIGLPGLLLLGAGLLWLLWRRQWFLPALVAGSLAVYWLNNRPDTRHLIIPFSIALLGLAIALADLWRMKTRRWQGWIVAGVIVWAIVIWLPFTFTIYTDPAALAISDEDYHQYIGSEGSGSGLAEVIRVLQPYEPGSVLGLLANCWALEYMVQDEDTLPLTCPRINPNGTDLDNLRDLLLNSREHGTYAIVEAVSYIPREIPGELIATIERPRNGPQLAIYHLGAD